MVRSGDRRALTCSARSPKVVRSITAATAPEISRQSGRQIGGGRLARLGRMTARDVQRRDASLDGPEHLAHRDPRWRPDQLVAPRRPALGLEDPGPLEEQEDLLQVALGNTLAARHLLDGDEPLAVVDGEVEEGADRVLALG